jgi:L-lactate dehydrogenase complex protein LldG
VGPEADLIALFAERARSAGMEVERTERSGAAAAAARILEDAGVRSAALAVEGELGADISAALERQGVTIAGAADQTLLAACYEAGAAVADAHAGIAETGTLVCLTDAVHARAHSLMPPLHLAVLRARDIVPDLLDHMRAMRARADDLPSAQILITGPSKTADIEGILITGVHGPGRVVVILVEDA